MIEHEVVKIKRPDLSALNKTKEHIEKVALFHRGRKRSPETCKRIGLKSKAKWINNREKYQHIIEKLQNAHKQEGWYQKLIASCPVRKSKHQVVFYKTRGITNVEWKRLRQEVLQRDKQCVSCGNRGNNVDLCCCVSCHNCWDNWIFYRK